MTKPGVSGSAEPNADDKPGSVDSTVSAGLMGSAYSPDFADRFAGVVSRRQSLAALEQAGFAEKQPADMKGRGSRSGKRRPRLTFVQQLRRFLRDLLVIVLIAIVVSFLIKTFLVRPFYIPSQSMVPTLMVNDRIIVNELVPNLVPIERGDVVVFRDPGGWLPVPVAKNGPAIAQWWDGMLTFIGFSAGDSDDHLVKRVIGLPGDHVSCCNGFGQLSVNGMPLKEPYIAGAAQGAVASRDPFDVVVPEGHLWVMGDNRNSSRDSRYQITASGKFVPIKNVVGRAIMIILPFNRISWIDNYQSVFEGIGASKETDSKAKVAAKTFDN